MESTFGDYISCGRNVRGITLRELAQNLEIDIIILSKIEKNWRQFPKDKLRILATVFLVPVEDVIKEFLKTDLVQIYGNLPNYEKIIIDILNNKDVSYSVNEIIKEGESKYVEFKSSLRYCLKSLKPEKHIEHSSMKNICAFLNSGGGKLIIGVSDEGEILGLEDTDYRTFTENDKKDAWLKHIDNLISKYFGNNISQYVIITFEIIDQKIITCINILPNNYEPTFLKNSEKNGNEEFYIRRNASAIGLKMEEFHKYTKERWQ